MHKELLLLITAAQHGLLKPAQLIEIGAAWIANPSKTIQQRIAEQIGEDASQTLENFISTAHAKDNITQTDISQPKQNHKPVILERLRKIDNQDDKSRLSGFGSFGGNISSESDVPQVNEKDSEILSQTTNGDNAQYSSKMLDNNTHITAEHPQRYTIHGEKGRGAIGKVLLAFDEHTGREIAVKELLPKIQNKLPGTGGQKEPQTTSTDEVSKARFLKEARVTAQLEHPSIIPVYEIGFRLDGTIYYTMRLVKGLTLFDAIRHSEKLNDRLKLLPHFHDICNAIAYAHSRNVIHRDIKPENVMIGEFGETVVLDWGLAKVHGQEDDEKNDKMKQQLHLLQEIKAGKTVSGFALGTPDYMPPEQAMGEIDEIDEKSDIYSLGAVLYEILTGVAPHTGTNAYEIVSKVISEKIVPVQDIVPEVPAELAAITMIALSKDKALRYNSASELATDVESYMAGEKVSIYEYTSIELITRFATRNKPAFFAIIGIFLMLIASVIFVSISYQEEIEARNKMIVERTKANYHISQALHEKSERLILRDKKNSAKVYAAASLLHNPAYAKSLYHDSGFAENNKQSITLAAEDLGFLYKQKLSYRAKLEKTIKNDSKLFNVEFSKNGAYFATAARNSNIYLYNANGQIHKVLTDHQQSVFSVEFSPDAAYLASASLDNSVIIWDVASGKVLKRFSGYKKGVYDVAFSPDGKLLAAATGNKTIHIHNLLDGNNTIINSHKGNVINVAFSPDGKKLASCGYDRKVYVYDLESKSNTHTFTGHSDKLFALSFSSSSRYLASAGKDKSIRIWDLADNKQVGIFEEHTATIVDLAWSKNEQKLFSASVDKTIRIWDTTIMQPELTLEAHSAGIRGIALSADERTLLSSGYDKVINQWRLIPKEKKSQLILHNREIYSLKNSYDNSLYVTASRDQTAHIIDHKTRRKIGSFTKHGALLSCADISPDKSIFATAGWDSTVKIWNTKSGELMHTLSAHTNNILYLDFSPSNKLLASAGYDKRIIIWDIESGLPKSILKGHTAAVSRSVFSPDGKLLASSSFDGTVKIWNVTTDNLIYTFSSHTDWVSDLHFFSNGTKLASAGKDGKIVIYDIAKKTVDFTMNTPGEWIRAIAISQTNDLLASSSADGTITFWNLPKDSPILRFTVDLEPFSIIFSPNDTHLIVAHQSFVSYFPVRFDILESDPKKLIEKYQKHAGMQLDGFHIVPAD